MGIPFCLRVIPLPPPPERPPTQLLTVLLPHLPYVPILGWVELPPSSHHFRCDRPIPVDRICPPDGVVTFSWIPVRKEETGSTLYVVCSNVCVRPVQQGLHFAGKSINGNVPTSCMNLTCTQYFLWYLLFLPLLIPLLSVSLWKTAALIGVWAGTQALWLSEAYKLEFLGENVFYGLWVRGLIYVLGNAWVLVQILGSYDRRPPS